MTSKYDPLVEFLRSRTDDALRISFDDIEGILGAKLPPSSKYRPWWSNNTDFAQARNGWLAAGWKTSKVDMNARELTLVRQQPRSPVTTGGGSGPKECLCGCGETPPRGDIVAGHEDRLRMAIEERTGGLANLWQIVGAVEQYVEGEIVETELGRILRKSWANK
jgi:hypothetical protein